MKKGGKMKRYLAFLIAGMLTMGSLPISVLASEDTLMTTEPASEMTDFDASEAEIPDDPAEYTSAEIAASVEEAIEYYTVTLNANGGYFLNEWDDAIGDYVEKTEVIDKQIPVGGSVEVFPVFTNPHTQIMTFAGWSLEPDGEPVSLGEKEYVPVENCNLYAVWEAADESAGVANTYAESAEQEYEEAEAVEETEEEEVGPEDTKAFEDAEETEESKATKKTDSVQEYEDSEAEESAQEHEETDINQETIEETEPEEGTSFYVYTTPETDNEQDTAPSQEVTYSDEEEQKGEDTEADQIQDAPSNIAEDSVLDRENVTTESGFGAVIPEKADEESVSTDPMLSSEPVTGVHMWYQYNGNIDIRGYTGNSTIQTTYLNNGYTTVLQCDGNKETLQFNQNGQAVSHTSGLTVTPSINFSSDDKYAIVHYTIRNTSTSAKTYNLGVCADVDIDSDDYASVYRTNNGLRMVDRSSGRTYYLVCKNFSGTPSAETLWFGDYSKRFDNIFNDANDEELTNVDSGLAFSWKNQAIDVGSTVTYSYQVGIGESGDYEEDSWHIIHDAIEYDFFFKTGEDTNQFIHYGLPYMFDDVNIKNKLYLSTLLTWKGTFDFYKYLDGNTSGVCHGIAMSMCYGNQGFIDYKCISDSASNYWQLGDPRNNTAFKDLILYYHLTQLSYGGEPSKKIDKDGWHIKSLETRLEDFLNALVYEAQKCSTSKKPFVFGYKENGDGHSVVVCGYIWNEKTKNHEIIIYDENSYDGKEGHYCLMRVPEDCKSFDFADANAVYGGYTIQDVWSSLSFYGIDKIYGSSNILRKSAVLGGYDESTTSFQISAGKAFRIEDEYGNWMTYDGSKYLGNMNVYDCYSSGLDNAPYWNITIDATSKLTLKDFEPGCELCTQIEGKGYVVSSNGADSISIQSDCIIAEGESYGLDVYVQSDKYDILQVQASCEGRTILNSVDDLIVVSSTGNCDNVKVWVYDQTVRDEYDAEINENGEVIINLENNNDLITFGSCGENAIWKLNSVGTLTISGSGPMVDFAYSSAAPWYNHTVNNVVIGDGITRIGDYAFCDSAMTTITLPESLESIGCFSLSGITGLNTINIPFGVTSIDQGAFAGSSYKANKITSITVDENNSTYSENNGVVYSKDGRILVAYPPGRLGEFSVPEGVQVIGDSAFSGCKGVTGISFPESVITIEDLAFAASGLSDITIPNTVQSIGESAFANCRELKSVFIEGPVKTLKQLTFNVCYNLKTIYLPESIEKIEQNTFFDCRSLQDVYFSGSERTWSKVVIEQGKVYDTYIVDATVHFAKENEMIVLDEYSVSINVNDQIWTGKPLTPNFDVVFDSEKIIEGTDYEVSYADNTNVGTATVTITGIGNYEGTVTENFSIAPASINNASVTGISNKTYTGSALTQNPTVKIGEKTLTKGTDYTLSYSNNKDAGTATINIIGKGNYTGTKTETFKINKAEQTITIKTSASSVAVGKVATVSISGAKGTKFFKWMKADTDTGAVTVDSSTGKVIATKVGIVTIKATSKATDNYNAASMKVRIKIVPTATASISATNQANGVKLTWKKVPGATGYLVYRGSTKIATIKSGSTVTYTDTKANTNGAKYVYKIIAYSSTGTSTLSKAIALFRVARPTIKTLKSSSSGKVTVTWSKNAKGTGYQIQYSSRSDFKTQKTVTLSNAKTVSKTISSLAKKHKYYVRVRTYKKGTIDNTKYYSAWSEAKTVKTK